MLASAQLILPPGFLSLYGAIDLIGRHLRPDWTGKEHDAVKAAKALIAPSLAKHQEQVRRLGPRKHTDPPLPFEVSLPAPIREALDRRKDAFNYIRELCAYGEVLSALLLDDFTVLNGIPTKNWLDNQISGDMLSTGRTTVRVPESPLHVSRGSGWVMIFSSGLEAALSAKNKPKQSSRGAEVRCETWLMGLANSDDGRTVALHGKAHWQDEATAKPEFAGLSHRGFERVWGAVAKQYPIISEAGRRPDSKN